MADFLSQFIGKDETPSVEFKHHRGNRKVSDSATSNEELDSLYDQLIEESSDDDIKAIVAKSEVPVVFIGRHTWADGGPMLGFGYYLDSESYESGNSDGRLLWEVPIKEGMTLGDLLSFLQTSTPPVPSGVSGSTTDTEFRIKDLRGDELKVKMDAIVKKINPLLTFVGVGTDFASHTLDFQMEADGNIHTIELPYDESTTVEDVAKMISPDVLEYPVVSDSTKKVKDAEGDDDDDDFEDEPEREFTDEEIIEWFKDGYDGDHHSLYVEAYRDKGYNDDIWETMDQLDEVVGGQPASWLLDRMFYGDFNPRHKYWKFNGYGNLESFDGSFDSLFDEHIDETIMVEYIRDHMDEHREDIEAYFEDDED